MKQQFINELYEKAAALDTMNSVLSYSNQDLFRQGLENLKINLEKEVNQNFYLYS